MDGNRDYEEILTAVGKFGVYHRIYLLAIALPLGIVGGMVFICNAILTDGIPRHHCVAGEDFYNSFEQTCNHTSDLYVDCLEATCGVDSLDQLLNQYQCQIDFSNVTHANVTSQCHDLPVLRCTSWEYTGSSFRSSVAMKFNLVCENSWKSQLASMMLMGGLLIGSLLFGQVNDRFGRRPAVVGSLLLLITSEFISTNLENFTIYCILQLLTGAAFIGAITSGYVTIMELTSVKHHVFAGQLIQIAFSVSQMLLAIFGYFIPDWRIVGMISSALAIPFTAAYALFIVESPRWLYANGNIAKGDQMVKKIARWNSTQEQWNIFLQQHDLTLPERKEMLDKNSIIKDNSSLGISDLFKHRVLRKFTFVLLYNWFVSACVFYGLSLNAGVLAGNVFLNIFFTGLVEIPGYVIAGFLLTKWGRRTVCSFMHMFSAISLLCMVFTQSSNAASLALFLMGKLGCSGAFGSIYLYTTELYPTSIRGIGVGLCSGISRVGGLVAVAILMLGEESPMLPYILFGALGLMAGILVCLLPETKAEGFPDTIAECKSLDERQKIRMSAFCC